MRLEEFFQSISTITMKLTMGCNLKCTYCNTETVTPKTPMMSIDLWKQAARLLIENTRERYVSMEFHGGEPMLLSDEWFEEACGYVKGLAKKHNKDVQLPMVTNGTLMTEERMHKLNSLGVRFCVSSDGPPEINDLQRGSGQAVENAIKLILANNINVGIMTVMSNTNYMHMNRIMDWLLELGVKRFSLNFAQPQGRGIDGDILSSEQMFEGMKQVFDHMYRTNVALDEGDMVRFIERFVEGREQSPRPTCWEFECQAGKSYCAIDLFGKIHACGSDVFNHCIGHVTHGIEDKQYNEKMTTLHKKTDWVLRCFDCPASRICNHSCPTSDWNSMQYKENECGFTKLLWTYLCENEDKVNAIYSKLMAQRRRPPMSSFVSLDQSAAIKPSPV